MKSIKTMIVCCTIVLAITSCTTGGPLAPSTGASVATNTVTVTATNTVLVNSPTVRMWNNTTYAVKIAIGTLSGSTFYPVAYFSSSDTIDPSPSTRVGIPAGTYKTAYKGFGTSWSSWYVSTTSSTLTNGGVYTIDYYNSAGTVGGGYTTVSSY